mgnify:CR=1 FL=1|jgi:hypothetical protein
MQVSRIIKENHIIDSKSFNELPPLMKEAMRDVFDLIEKETGSVIERFEGAVAKVAEFHGINIQNFYDYVDKEVLEQLGEK